MNDLLKIYPNTDAQDIREACIGFDVYYGEIASLHANRGLHIQIRHNFDPETFAEAAKVGRVITNAFDLCRALENLLTAVHGPLNLIKPAVDAAQKTLARSRGEP